MELDKQYVVDLRQNEPARSGVLIRALGDQTFVRLRLLPKGIEERHILAWLIIPHKAG
jgi:hypothetical protein